MTEVVQIGDKLVGDGQPVYLIAEIGINHNGDIDLAKRLIDKGLKLEPGVYVVQVGKRKFARVTLA